MGPTQEALALADFLIAKYGLAVDRYALAYAIMEHEEAAIRADDAQQPAEAVAGGGSVRIFLDCEFNEFQGDLISMALVAENGSEWYASLGCENPGSWVAQHVMPIIGIEPVSKVSFQISLRKWLAQFETIHVVADWPEDIAHFCQALITGPGSRLDTPPLTMEVLRIDASSDLPHNALADARGIRREVMRLRPSTMPPPAIDIGKLRELVVGLRESEDRAAADAANANEDRDAYAHGFEREAYKDCADQLAALIGDGGEKGNG